MRKLLYLAILVGTFGIPSAVTAQEGEQERSASSLLEALELPERAHQLREAGVDNDQVVEALDALRQLSTSAAEAGQKEEGRAARAARILEAEAETAREHGPMDNFGEFVRREIKAGKQGPELAESIRGQRETRRPAVAERAGERGERGERGAPDRAERERPEAAGEAGERGGADEASSQRGAAGSDAREQRGAAGADASEERGAEERGAAGRDRAPSESEEAPSKPKEAPSGQRGRSNR